jgi:hypothetical protein
VNLACELLEHILTSDQPSLAFFGASVSTDDITDIEIPTIRGTSPTTDGWMREGEFCI